MDLFKNKEFGPMLLNEIETPFDSKEYVYEVKYDGIRALIFVNDKSIKIQSRNKQDLTNLFPELNKIKDIVDKNVIFDGEIISFKNGRPSFLEIQKRIRIKNYDKINYFSKNNPVIFMAFDIIYENKNLNNMKLIERKKILNKYQDNDVFVKVKMIDTFGIKLFKSIKKLGLEGIVAKLKNGLYHINKRTDDFIKIKNLKEEEFIIGGYEIKKNKAVFISLGTYIENKFYYVGKVLLPKNNYLYNKVINESKSKNYFCNFNEKINYIKPSITCNIRYLEKTSNNYLRHPVIKDI